uniref:SEC7 domain-containing protein n=1 Tax=Salix viminalis TaxID=40686 RepID=A0A6N2M2V0_SALVM
MKGIEFVINANKLGNSVEEIAAFLKNTSGLNKTLIGDYLGGKRRFFTESLDFDEAIRVFLQGFRLPGEAQKIDRIMEKFAERYCKCNAKVFSSADTAYVLAYSVILLNTDAHKPMVKNKMSADDFIRNNRGIDDGKDLPEQYLRFLFERISKKEIKMKEYDLALQQKQPLNSNRVLGLDSILNIRFISSFTAGITGVLPQAPMKTDASSGDTNSFQDDQSTLHGGSQIQKSVEVESAADFERQLPYDYAETMVQMTGSIPSPALSQMSNMSNTKRFIKLIGGRERGRKNKSMKMSAGQPGFGSPWSLFEDQALVALVHDMGPNWELISDAINSTGQFKFSLFRW